MTDLYCLLGNPVSHSLSPVMHNYGFKKFNIDAVYVAFNVTDIRRAVDGIRGLGIKGASITIPFKEKIMDFLDEISDDAKKIGAVNTILNRDGKLIGMNTDWIGVLKAVENFTPLRHRRILIFGTGGAARAAIYAVKKGGGFPVVLGRRGEKAMELAEYFHCEWISMEDLENHRFYGIINCTPIGMDGFTDKIPIPHHVFKGMEFLVDLVYKRGETSFMKMAKEMNLKYIISGIDILILQGIEQFKIWTGKELSFIELKKILEGK